MKESSDCHNCRLLPFTPGSFPVYVCTIHIQEDLMTKNLDMNDFESLVEARKMRHSGSCPYFQKLSEEEQLERKNAKEHYEKHVRNM